MTTITLSDRGVTLILLENELANNTQAIRRWTRRYTEAETELQELRKQREQLVGVIEKIKESL